MSSIDDKYLDVTFDRCPEFVAGDLGCRDDDDFCASYEELYGVLNEREIDAAIEQMDAAGGGAERLVTRIYNQGQEGSCVANATCQAHEIVQAKQYGKERVTPLSAISLYKRIGRSASSGAMVSDGWTELQRRGAIPLDTPTNRQRFAAVMPNTGFRTPFPAGWENVAAEFAGLEATIVRTLPGIWTALVNQHPVVVGRGGHSIVYVRPMRRDGRRIVAYANSWGSWGQGLGDFKHGFGFDSQSQISASARWAFALRSVRAPQP